MTTRPSAELRRRVIVRANDCCEYCLMPQNFVVSTHPVDHIIAEKHGGQTTSDNLALSCTLCNLRKASDIASIDPETSEMVSLFHPRQMFWAEHFILTEATIVGVTSIGRTTAHFLQLNLPERILERSALIRAGIRLTADIKKPR